MEKDNRDGQRFTTVMNDDRLKALDFLFKFNEELAWIRLKTVTSHDEESLEEIERILCYLNEDQMVMLKCLALDQWVGERWEAQQARYG